MSEFLGSRISLISKSDIRYSGILHEINSEESTVSLENVKSYGTEGRRGNPSDEVAASDQIYEYIVFRGSDVKDLRIEQAPAAPKENQPPPVPDDPAIVGARTRPTGAIHPGPPNQIPGHAGFAQNPYPPNFYAPPGQWGRGGPGPGPVPGPGPAPQGFNGMPYPPPPGWFPPGQGFPPGGPGPWNNYGYPPGPQGPQGPPSTPGQGIRVTPPQDNKPAPIGAGVDKQKPVGVPAPEAPTEPKNFGQHTSQPISKDSAPTPPVESKPTAAEVKATADSLSATKSVVSNAEPKSAPTGPRSSRITPAVPMPAAILSRSGPQAIAAAASVKPAAEQSNGPPSAATLRDATQAAKAAVAVAMAKLDNPGATVGAAGPTTTNTAMDNLTKKVNEMRVNARGGPSSRGRSRGGRGGIQSKIEVPDADFDFQTANAKFNKQDLAKEAVSISPVGDAPNGSAPETPEPEDGAYNKTRSFFDNISSEARERAENGGQKPGGREWRGEEQRKNMETFGQGSVDGGYRGGYRGRGRGRGRGNSRGRGGPRGRGTFTQSNAPQ
ncbi:putative g2 m phase checkpoint control protein [Rosellinia necatrix]|uniref:Putative g2 m phase checkpoint control protein n=1 Tax=Rosellinia necatrix TaxID=77044 RepID=A0A1W2TC82_ROSNE|nr:putative g2 m phase checkpoint control protein [Rosellinia necatrix]